MKLSEKEINKAAHDLALLALQRKLPGTDHLVPSQKPLTEMDLYQEDHILVKNYFIHLEKIRKAMYDYLGKSSK